MIELDDNFGLEQLGNVKKESFEILYNKTRIDSFESNLYITPDKMYCLVKPNMGAPKSWCIDLSEIATYGKYGLGGFQITLKDGKVLRFTNVFRKLRNAIVEALEERKN